MLEKPDSNKNQATKSDNGMSHTDGPLSSVGCWDARGEANNGKEENLIVRSALSKPRGCGTSLQDLMKHGCFR